MSLLASIVLQNTLNTPIKIPHNCFFLFKPNATMNYLDSR